MSKDANQSVSHADGDNRELAALEAEVRMLRKQITQSEHLKQEVLELSHRLDQECARFNAMQDFIRHAVQVDSDSGFMVLVCESIVDLLGCGVGMFWCFQCEQDMACMVQTGLGEVTEHQWQALSDWIGNWLSNGAPIGKVAEIKPLPPILGVREDFHVELVKDSSGKALAALFACNTQHQAGFRDGFPYAVDSVFGTFANQVGILIESLKRRSTIIGQIERIRVSEERLSTALTTGNVGLWDWDLKAGRVFYSSQWKNQLGLDENEVGDAVEDWSRQVHPDDIAEAWSTAARCAAEPGGFFDMTVRMRHKDGRWLWINSRGFNVSIPKAGIFRVIGTHIDVTSHKVLERKLLESESRQRLAREQAERESSAKSSFLAAISHEIRTPLNGMLGAFQMLRVTDECARRERLIEMGERAGKWMIKIIGESLDIIRIEAGKLDLNLEIIDLRNLLDELRALEETKTSGRNIDYRWNVAPDVPRYVRADPVRLRQILANLVGNAVKFTREGFIQVDVIMGRQPIVGKRCVRFSVSDSGVGISKEFRKVIFQPFTQETRKSESGEHGIGLGLVITKELVTLMGGVIRAWSRPGIGSRFVVRLPLEEIAAEGNTATGMVGKARKMFSGKVLLAEDDDTSGELGRMMMCQLGLEVDLAKDGGIAFEMAASQTYDLIFMDCWMPVKNGIEVARELRSSSAARSAMAPIIALTANARKSDELECRDAGMNAFMAKPLLFENLIEVLGAYLPVQLEQAI